MEAKKISEELFIEKKKEPIKAGDRLECETNQGFENFLKHGQICEALSDEYRLQNGNMVVDIKLAENLKVGLNICRFKKRR